MTHTVRLLLAIRQWAHTSRLSSEVTWSCQLSILLPSTKLSIVSSSPLSAMDPQHCCSWQSHHLPLLPSPRVDRSPKPQVKPTITRWLIGGRLRTLALKWCWVVVWGSYSATKARMWAWATQRKGSMAVFAHNERCNLYYNAKEFVLARIVCRVADIFVACWWRRRRLTVLRVFTVVVVVVLLCFACMNNTDVSCYGIDQKIRAWWSWDSSWSSSWGRIRSPSSDSAINPVRGK